MRRGTSSAQPPAAGFEDSTGFLLAQVGRAARSAWSQALADRGLTPSAHAVLLVLRQSGPLPLTELAAAVRSDPRNMGPVLDAMPGLVERRPDPQDRRRRTAGLTRAGRAAADDLAGATRAAEEALLEPLDAPERATLHRLLSTLSRRR